MDAWQAALQIDEIKSRLARAQIFRGYRSRTVGATGALAFLAAGVQIAVLPEPSGRPFLWLSIWIAAAAISLVLVGVELAVQCRRSQSNWVVRLTVSAVGQFLPCILAGGAVTATLAAVSPHNLCMLPGLWCVIFGLGVFSSCSLLPREIGWVGGFYLAAGILNLICARQSFAFSPLAMAAPFGLGQFLTAVVLYWRLERNDDETEPEAR